MPITQDRCGSAMDANWASQLLWGENQWTDMLQGSQLNRGAAIQASFFCSPVRRSSAGHIVICIGMPCAKMDPPSIALIQIKVFSLPTYHQISARSISQVSADRHKSPNHLFREINAAFYAT